MNIEDIFHRTIDEYGMIKSGDKIVVGVSGGPDSITLLHLLLRYSRHYGIQLIAAHLNHNFRPGYAEKEAEYVEEFCRERGIRCIAEFVDVPEMAAVEGLSSEQAGRKARYHLFNRVMAQERFNKIAVAHNLNDQVETVVMRLIRGSGVEGLGGIKPVRGNVIRPLLDVPRPLIEKYCDQNALEPVTDKSNFQPVYFRNRIRLELLPYLRDKYNNNIDRAVLGMAEILRQENDFLSQLSRQEFNRLASCISTDRLEFCIADLFELHTALRRRVLRMAVEHLRGNVDNLELTHVRHMCTLLEAGKTGKRISLPGGLTAGIEYERFFIFRGQAGQNSMDTVYKLVIPGETYINETDGVIEAHIMGADEYLRERDLAHNNRVFLDLDITGRNLVVTGRKEGDTFKPFGMNGTKKIKDFFIDLKIPRDRRDIIPILRNDTGIIWVAGYRIDQRFKINRNTQQVLKLEYKILSAKGE